MTFEEIVDQAIEMVRRRGQVSYRLLKRQFNLDDESLEDVKEELLFSHPVVDEDGRGLVWTGETEAIASQPTRASESSSTQHDQPAQALPPEPPTPDAERRQLTVMFCDVADATKLSGQLDPEDLRDVIHAYQSTSAEVIERYDGYIAQHLGDGLMVYFGWPQAHEDDAQRAVHAGLGILEAMRGLNARLEKEKGIRLAIRIGIHTGLVVVGEIGQGVSREHLALGETPNIASRIEGIAQPNTLAISEATYQLVQGYFNCEALGRHTLKGMDEPQPVYRVMGESGLESRFLAATTRGLTALVGREEEIALLGKRWSQAKAGEGQVVLLCGEAGIGKSRITEALREQIANEPHLDMHYQCSPYHTHTAFYPITEQFAFVAGFTRHDTPGAKLDKLEAHLRQIGLMVPEVAPLFADALSIPTAGRYPPLDITPQRQKERTIEALAERLLAAARQQPVLFIAEDLHWSDPSSLEAIGRIMAQLAAARVLMVCTYRPDFAVPWGLDGPITTLRLNRLSRSQTTALIDAVTDRKSLPRDVVEQIVAKSDGVPLYVEELTKHVLESVWLNDKEDHYDLTVPLPTLSIPATLQDALTARLDRLPEAREVAQLGAVIGREFSYTMLQSLTTLGDAMLQSRLMQLAAAELVYQRGRPPQAAYVFKHALIQDAAYQSLLRSTRQQYHQRIAQVMEERFPETVEAQPELLAYHFTKAGEDETAIGYWQRAGEQAIQRSAHAEAIAHLTEGLALLTTSPETPKRLNQELDFQVAMGVAYRATKSNAAPEVKRAYDRALKLCQQIGDSPHLFSVLRGLMTHYHTRAQFQEAYQLGEQLLHLAQSQHEPAHLMSSHYALGRFLFNQGELMAARTHHMQALAIYDPQEHQPIAVREGTPDAGMNIHSHLAWEMWLLGYPDHALKHIHNAIKLSQDMSHAYSLVHAFVFAAMLHQFRREIPAVHDQAEAAITLGTEQGFADFVSRGRVLHGWALAMQGQDEAGIAEIRQGLTAILATGNKQLHSYSLGLLAEPYGKSDRPEEGLSLLTEALTVMGDTEVRFYETELYRLKGALLLKQATPDTTQAETCFHQAIAIARHQQAKSWELRAATSLARLWQFQDKRQDAHNLLASVYGWLCVQPRLACSVEVSPTRVRIRSPVAWMAGERETQPLKPIDKAIFGMVASHRAAA